MKKQFLLMLPVVGNQNYAYVYHKFAKKIKSSENECHYSCHEGTSNGNSIFVAQGIVSFTNPFWELMKELKEEVCPGSNEATLTFTEVAQFNLN